jgi:hypothetical protein
MGLVKGSYKVFIKIVDGAQCHASWQNHTIRHQGQPQWHLPPGLPLLAQADSNEVAIRK